MSDDERKRKSLYAIIAGILLLISGAHGSLGDIPQLIIAAASSGFITVQIARFLITLLIIIAFLGGISVIIGGFLLRIKLPTVVSNFLISIGSGVSVFNFVIEIILIGPALKLAILRYETPSILNLGFRYIIIMLAIFFVFMALIKDVIGFIIAFIAGFLMNVASSFSDFLLILNFLGKLGIVRPPLIIVNLLTISFFSGSIFLASAILNGYKIYKLGFILGLIAIALYVLPFLAILISTVLDLINVIRIIIASVGMLFGVLSIVMGFQKLSK
ncbi:MAG: hypothetical protein J7L07_08590 [Candidatus Odinarchaeota archaeon]|nr:hypothetical protein [Candidatus Odinarchaeota archaeon]